MIFLILTVIPWAGYLLLRTIHYLHMLQLEEYGNRRFWRWVAAEPKRLVNPLEPLLGLGALFSATLIWIVGLRRWAGPLLLFDWAVSYALLGLLTWRRRREAKKPLAYTARAVRLLAAACLIPVVVVVASAWFGARPLDLVPALGELALLNLLPVLALATGFSLAAALNVLLANVLVWPVEELVRRYYLRSARAKVRKFGPQIIGVTGSYGKTTTKEIIAALLSRQYNVIKPPESYNTLMGVCKVINGELSPEHEIFVVEMGAYERGEIAELCRLTPPNVGVLTAIGPQHLERFGSIENVEKAKYELIEALPADGVAVFNNDDPRCRALSDATTGKVVRYSSNAEDMVADVVARELRLTSEGSTFFVKAGGMEQEFHTRLLGKHNVANVLAGTAVALQCGLTLDEVRQGVAELEPVPHRLQLIQGQGGVTVIDDAYSANPVGAEAALDVLSRFHGGAKVLVTPGFVELGEREAEENRAFGRRAAGVCDHVILVGQERTAPIRDGLSDAGFRSENTHVVKSLDDATAKLQTLLRPGDVVLFENDLPDTYTES